MIRSNGQEVEALIIDPLLKVLLHSPPASAPAAMLEIQEKAAAALRGLAEESPELGTTILAAGASAVLSRLVETSRSGAVRLEAGKALRILLGPTSAEAKGTAEAVGLETMRLMAEAMSLSECPHTSGAMRTEAARFDARKRSRGDT